MFGTDGYIYTVLLRLVVRENGDWGKFGADVGKRLSTYLSPEYSSTFCPLLKRMRVGKPCTKYSFASSTSFVESTCRAKTTVQTLLNHHRRRKKMISKICCFKTKRVLNTTVNVQKNNFGNLFLTEFCKCMPKTVFCCIFWVATCGVGVIPGTQVGDLTNELRHTPRIVYAQHNKKEPYLIRRQ